MTVLTEAPKSASTTIGAHKKSILKVPNTKKTGVVRREPKKTKFENPDPKGKEKKTGNISAQKKSKKNVNEPKPKRKKSLVKPKKSSDAKGLSKLHRLLSAADYLARLTHFSVEECKALLYIHHKLEHNGHLDRQRMREVLHVMFQITDGIMLDLAYKAFDKDNDNRVNEEEWVQGLSIMLRGTTEELSDWCYFIYDMNGDGGIAREELTHCLKGCIIPGYGGVEADEAEECEMEIVELAMRKLDIDKDGQITREDFAKASRRDPLLLVSVGPCLPPVKCCAAFMAIVTEKFRKFTGPLGKDTEKKNKTTPHQQGMIHSVRRLSAIASRIETAKSQPSARVGQKFSQAKMLTEKNELRFQQLISSSTKILRGSKD